MRLIQFSFYYVQLRLMKSLGLLETLLPLDLTWRYNFWQRRIGAKDRRISSLRR